ncbi:thermonuclease family protein [Pontibacter akesuensis]|uniref:Endonuclease YncB, thermonuclease family n=1 Tax=Pontibacter akesuensis TaxID=388950 RepID=A0A1I7H040_9BACT|nr:thermonuclease family protein [Pontibacter akesuensis]GHA54194.1 hypothetical protein GCM10007389_01840 [Pontibacter akesuensis]SFU54053.1 Endonuclease YncB, thermonuclease family [Pontibacter akesuensis]
MKKYIYLFLAISQFTACQSDHQEGQEQFRERQEAILERAQEQEAATEPAAEEEVLILEETEGAPASVATPAPSTTAGDKVVAIKDGDTVVLLRNGKEETVRLYGVDTPEKTQAFGQKAKQYASDLAFGKQVRLIVNNTDRYGRTVGTIILPDGRSLNEELVKDGYAWHYKAYSNDKNLANAEADARRFKRGLWQDPNPVAPWDYRKEKRGGATAESTASAPVPAGATKRVVYLCNSTGSNVYHLTADCYVLKRCKEEVIRTTEAVAIRTHDRRVDKVCSR